MAVPPVRQYQQYPNQSYNNSQKHPAANNRNLNPNDPQGFKIMQSQSNGTNPTPTPTPPHILHQSVPAPVQVQFNHPAYIDHLQRKRSFIDEFSQQQQQQQHLSPSSSASSFSDTPSPTSTTAASTASITPNATTSFVFQKRPRYESSYLSFSLAKTTPTTYSDYKITECSRSDLNTNPNPNPKSESSSSSATVEIATDTTTIATKSKTNQAPRKRRKTKTICLSCVARKIRCDKGKPICKNCLKRQVACVYPRLDPTDDDEGEFNLLEALARSNSANYKDEENNGDPNKQRRRSNDVSTGGALSSEGVDYIMNQVEGAEVGITNKGTLVLPSQQPEKFTRFPALFKDPNMLNYRLYSQIDFQFVEYYTTQYYMKLSKYFPVQKAFLNIFGHSFTFPHLIHIIMGLVSLDFYHNASKLYVEQKNGRMTLKPKIPEAKLIMERDSYLKFSEFHQTKSISLFRKHLKVEDEHEGMTTLTASVLQFMYYIFSPNYKFIDEGFFNLASGISHIYQSTKRRKFFNTQDVIPSESLKIITKPIPYTKQELAQAYAPIYLYGLLDPTPFETSPQSLERLRENQKTYKAAIQSLLDCFYETTKLENPETDFLNILIRWTIDHALIPQFQHLVVVEKDPRSLIIMAHFLMLLSSMINLEIWSQSTFVEEINYVEDTLNNLFSFDSPDYIQVPFSEFENGNKADGESQRSQREKECKHWISWLDVPKKLIYELASRDLDGVPTTFNFNNNATATTDINNNNQHGTSGTTVDGSSSSHPHHGDYPAGSGRLNHNSHGNVGVDINELPVLPVLPALPESRHLAGSLFDGLTYDATNEGGDGPSTGSSMGSSSSFE
ncbi:unnamed protein product [Ambrosiozyma monospora]|uniref:Unnamed protein product n=1 Tax=Ambrosiozyma monospora TaxID=43982 RepID=A0A9W6YP62_AMBMO|nr:unnamed protein product [Ambrosiozyma monospora]